MNKKAPKVNYPKKKARLNIDDFGDIDEPERKSVYQTLLGNLKACGRATFVHRVIYVGNHNISSYDECRGLFCTLVTKCNEGYFIEKLTGFLLYYPHYFVHMIEGDEDNINKQIGMLINPSSDHFSLLGKIKLLLHVSNINQRFFEEFASVTGTPAKLLESLDVNADLQQSGRHVYNCIKKMYMLMSAYADDDHQTHTTTPDRKQYSMTRMSSLASEDSRTQVNTSGLSYMRMTSSTALSDRSMESTREYRFFLPEFELLDFIIESSFTMTMKDYYEIYNNVPMRDIYKDKVWPVPHDFIPYDVFEKPYDCPTELPKGLRQPRHGQRQKSGTQTTRHSLVESIEESEKKDQGEEVPIDQRAEVPIDQGVEVPIDQASELLEDLKVSEPQEKPDDNVENN